MLQHLSPPALKAFVRRVADEMVLSRTRVKAAVDRVAARGTTEYEVAGSHNKKRRVLNDEQALYVCGLPPPCQCRVFV